SFNPAIRLIDQVCEAPLRHALMSRQEAQAWAVELFSALDLPDPKRFGERYPHQVSGGQLQRGMAALAMSARPEILLLHEPTTALDVTTQIEVLALLKKLIREHGTAALYITHDLAVVAQVADRILVLRHGRMVEVGETARILGAPETPYTRALVAERKAAGSVAATGDAPRLEPILEINHVTGASRSLRAVKDVSFTVARGETVAVVGESGSGKTSLAMAIAGLVARQAGELRFRGKLLAASYTRRPID